MTYLYKMASRVKQIQVIVSVWIGAPVNMQMYRLAQYNISLPLMKITKKTQTNYNRRNINVTIHIVQVVCLHVQILSSRFLYLVPLLQYSCVICQTLVLSLALCQVQSLVLDLALSFLNHHGSFSRCSHVQSWCCMNVVAGLCQWRILLAICSALTCAV